MKKILSLLLALGLVLGLCACGAPATQTEPTETAVDAAKEALDGKKIIFIGNSYTYVGKVVYQVYNSHPELEKRQNDRGFFWQLCQMNGIDVDVTNWTFSSHRLHNTFREPCAIEGDCFGLNHEDYLTDRVYDYVVIQPHANDLSQEHIKEDIDYIMNLFREANPDVKFVIFGCAALYGHNTTGKSYPEITGYFKELAEQDHIIADWGNIVTDVVNGKTAVPGSQLPYDNASFVISDGHHPSLLGGYLATMTVFCAITGKSALELPADFFISDTERAAMVEKQLKGSYERGELDTNFHTALSMESEVKGFQQLVDQYLSEKPYMQ